MNAATRTAAIALLASMTSEQRTTLMDVLSMHIENVECSDVDGSAEETLASDGHLFLVSLRDATISDLG